jgi:enterobactin synthetase component D
MTMKNCLSLFSKSHFFFIDKEVKLSSNLLDIKSRLVYPLILEQFHAGRRDDFLLGRICASKAYQLCFSEELLSLPVGESKAPQWPHNALGSISHSRFMVGAAVAKKEDLLGVGIDFESLGRLKEETSRVILTDIDIRSVSGLSEHDLLTLIFSAKESLYKALYPIVRVFFGFNAAAVTSIDIDSGTFVIELTSEISAEYGPTGRASFYGKFSFDEKNILTVIEIPNLA